MSLALLGGGGSANDKAAATALHGSLLFLKVLVRQIPILCQMDYVAGRRKPPRGLKHHRVSTGVEIRYLVIATAVSRGAAVPAADAQGLHFDFKWAAI